MKEKNGFQLQQNEQWHTVAPGVQRMMMGYNKDMMMVKVKFEKDAIGEPHSHPHIQSTYIAQGSFEVTIDGKTTLLNEGDSFLVASNLVHGVVCKQAGLLIDVFNPCREDFLRTV